MRPAHLEPVSRSTNVLRGVGLAAVNAVATACAKGHPFNAANTYVRPEGWRDCRSCKRMRQSNYLERLKEAA